jgi:3'(2'), 5'-bisphosphate nucleotidase
LVYDGKNVSFMKENSEELKIAIETAREAGQILLQYYDTDLTVETKENNTPVSNADYAADNFIVKNLKTHFSYPILSEESVDDEERLRAEKVWIVDPLDGTKDFIAKTGEFTVCIALVENNQPILGVVYRPTTRELFYAQKGSGSFRELDGNAERLSASACDLISDAKFIVSKLNDKHAAFMDRIGAKNRVRVGSAALKVCKVAQGEYDAYFILNPKLSEWDDCAAGLILTEAGGEVSDVFGNPLPYNQKNVSRVKGILASNKNLYKELLKRIAPVAKEEYLEGQ